ncbi:deoxycytidylate deaminase [Photobacterium leiognathi]|uniref:deoxycytidylate deaminase n=1 Tax=Photobacterium leiognathi TaxID=553611 RepID=UPI0027342D56|nr:deaminase [Photobacterium leiognathi]
MSVGNKFTMNSKVMDKWDQRFCELAKHVSTWSRDSTKVGAVLFSKKGGDITVGYNGFPIGVEDTAERYDDKDTKLEFVVHAEVNAIIAAGSRAQGATLYVYGKPICARCAGPIIQSGIKRVVAMEPKTGTDSRWDKSGKLAYQMFIEAGIDVGFYSVDDENEVVELNTKTA